MSKDTIKKRVTNGLLIAIIVALAASSWRPAIAQDSAHPIDPAVLNILKEMSDYLKNYQEYSFSAEVTTDDVTLGDRRIHVTDKVEAVVQRPNRLWINEAGDLYQKRFWYDGRNLTLMSLSDGFYSTAKAAKNIDDTMDQMMDQYGLATPVVDFVVSDAYESLTDSVTAAAYAGLHTVDGIECHHLVFSNAYVDWEIWIDDGRHKLPRKFIVTYKNEPGEPETVTVFKEWIFNDQHAPQLFEFTAPRGAQKIEFLSPTDM